MVNIFSPINIFKQEKKLKLLFVASEAAPFVKVGGLGEVMRSLPGALRTLGHDTRIFIPKYATIDTEKYPLRLELKDLRPASSEEEDPHGLFVSNILKYDNNSGETIAYFLENMEYYEKRANVYGYTDDAIRWALLSRAVLEFLRHSSWRPDVIIAADWQSGLIPNYFHTIYKDDPKLLPIAVVFSIHNLSFQAMYDHHFVSEMDYDSGRETIPAFNDQRLSKLNFMRRGIMYADVINTVSSTYSHEITTPEYGEGLHELLSERQSRLFGILNGIDTNIYNPEADPNVQFHYNIKTLDLKIKNKSALQQKFNLPVRGDIPLFGIVSRLTDQKGFGLLMDAAEPLLENFDIQLIVVGSGEGHFMTFFQELAKKYPQKVGIHLNYDEVLGHMVYAGADAVIIPSRFEPCGLTQMEAMAYGAVPIVRKTGGLADSVIDYDPAKKIGTGFVFEKFDNRAFYGAMVRAIETYRYPEFWRDIQNRAMKTDFSWTKSAQEYVKLFKKAIEYHVLG
ncbi:MAG: glycogen synthase [Patescibacteria group bacterium]